MKKIILPVSAALLVLCSFTYSVMQSWSIDSAHSRLGFKVKHMGISDANGAFDKVTCSVNTANDVDFNGATFEMTIDANSINTGLDARDNHLMSDDFFAVSKFPTLQFKSTSCKKMKDNKYQITGALTMHGITKEVTLDATHNGNAKNRAGSDIAGFYISGKINRLDFEVGKDMPLAVVENSVLLQADLEFVKN